MAVSGVTKFLGGLALGGVGMLCMKNCENAQLTHQVRTEVRNSGISNDNFQKLDSKIGGIMGFGKKDEPILKWQEALDSIKTKGKVDKAYFQGAQMVRDSIKLAQKVK